MNDYLRELHAENPDAPSIAECQAETEEQLRQLEAGDYSSVPPWITPSERPAMIAEVRSQLARYRAMTGV